MTDRELMQQALSVLCNNAQPKDGVRDNRHLTPKSHAAIYQQTIDALRERLAQPVVIPPYLTQPNTKAPEQELVTGNLLKDAYNAMVEKKTRSQKLREAGFTRRPKGWEKEKDEQEPVAWRYRAPVEDEHWVWNYATYMDDPQNRRWCEALYTTPPQRKPLTHPQIHEFDWPDGVSFDDILSFVRAIEETHGIKEKNT